VSAEAHGKDKKKIGPKGPARQSGILQAALEEPEPEDAQKNEAIFQAKRDAPAVWVELRQVRSCSGQNRNQHRREQECYAASPLVHDGIRQ
jgi:hypothetical protein